MRLRNTIKMLIPIFVVAGTLCPSPQAAKNLTKKDLREWEQTLVGRVYYLLEPNLPLLANDAVKVVDCKIRKTASTIMIQSNGERVEQLSVKVILRFRGVAPAPGVDKSLTLKAVSDSEELDRILKETFSTSPLEDLFEWNPEIKAAVRDRVITLGMDMQMVRLILGGFPFDVDQELLDDGRVQETWKLQISSDTRKVFTSRKGTYGSSGTALSASSTNATVHSSVIDVGGMSVGSASADTSGSSTTHASTSGWSSESSLTVFSGLPPEFLHVVFTDGKVTARKTEFVK